MEIKGIYNTNRKILEIYHNDELIVEEMVRNPSDEWHCADLNDKIVDFNLWSENNEDYKLTLYPDVFVDQNGFYNTNCYKYEQIPLITI